MKVNEIFSSIQGEGKYAGEPVMFIRLAGCTRACDFCDTKYHTDFKEMSELDIMDIMHEEKPSIIVWTGGEPLMQLEEIAEFKNELMKTEEGRHIKHHVETNGDLLYKYMTEVVNIFDYICVSPKIKIIAAQASDLLSTEFSKRRYDNSDEKRYDIKVVTDGMLNADMFKYATMLMPLTIYPTDTDENININDLAANRIIQQKVWNYCVETKLTFCLRQHVHVWGLTKKGI